MLARPWLSLGLAPPAMQIVRSSLSSPVIAATALQPLPPALAQRQGEKGGVTADSSPSASALTTADRPASDPLQDPAIQRVIAELAARDREVRTHEQAHVAAGGELITSGPSYTYQVGPDRRRYAVGGEVGIDTSPVRGDPEATLDKAARIAAAAMAPAQPSAQDRRVAAQAGQMAAQARLEIVLQRARDAYASTPAESPAARLSVFA